MGLSWVLHDLVNVLLHSSHIHMHVRTVYTCIYTRKCMYSVFLYFPMFITIKLLMNLYLYNYSSYVDVQWINTSSVGLFLWPKPPKKNIILSEKTWQNTLHFWLIWNNNNNLNSTTRKLTGDVVREEVV